MAESSDVTDKDPERSDPQDAAATSRRRKLLPHEVAFRLAQATQQLSDGNPRGAELTLRELLAHDPANGSALNQLSILSNLEGRSQDAEALARAAIASAPRRPEFHFSLGRALKMQDRFAEAVDAYRDALRLNEKAPEVLVSLGIAQRRLGQLDAAIASYRRALRLNPGFAEALVNWGNALAEKRVRQGNGHVSPDELREAERIQRRAVELAPRNADAQHNLAVTLKFMSYYDEACEVFNRALALAPQRADTCVQFGDLLFKTEHLDQAKTLYERWLAANAPDVEVMLGLAMTLIGLGETESARGWIDKVLLIDPHSAVAHHMLGQVLQQTVESNFDARTALLAYGQAMRARPDYYEAHCAFLMTSCYIEEDPETLFQDHRSFGERFGQAHHPLVAPQRAGGERIRIGYLSYDFKRHSVMYFLEGLLRTHDRSQFEVFCYKNNHSSDEVTQRVAKLADHWIESGRLSDTELAERIAADRIDVLLDLSGLTAGTRLGVFTRRPAACQINYLGYPTSTGTAVFDFRITDHVIDPPGAERFNTESLLRCAHSMFCYEPDHAPDVTAGPRTRRDFVTFGSFNNMAKLSPHTLDLWARTLSAVPRSKLRLKARALSQRGNQDALRTFFSARGIAADRILLDAWRPDLSSHLDIYHEVDIALDTFPYNGATTTCEALWMGLPVISLCGATHPSRMGRSILSAAGRPGWAVDSDAHFVELAKRLATDPAALQEWRSGARAHLSASPLFDRPRFTRDFEGLLRLAFDRSRDANRAAQD